MKDGIEFFSVGGPDRYNDEEAKCVQVTYEGKSLIIPKTIWLEMLRIAGISKT